MELFLNGPHRSSSLPRHMHPNVGCLGFLWHRLASSGLIWPRLIDVVGAASIDLNKFQPEQVCGSGFESGVANLVKSKLALGEGEGGNVLFHRNRLQNRDGELLFHQPGAEICSGSFPYSDLGWEPHKSITKSPFKCFYESPYCNIAYHHITISPYRRSPYHHITI